MKDNSFPAWYYGPNGASDVFSSVEDVPAGWQDHPSKVHDDGKPKPAAAQVPGTSKATGDSPLGNQGDAQTGDIDVDGWPWDETLHAATKSKTQQGLWRMKVGVSRPDPKPGYPKPAAPLDL